MIYKLRNPGGIESWFNKEQADALLTQDGWTLVETRDENAHDTATTPPVEEPLTTAEATVANESHAIDDALADDAAEGAELTQDAGEKEKPARKPTPKTKQNRGGR